MFNLPKLSQAAREQTTISQFIGVDLRVRAVEGSCRFTKNVHSLYPCLTVQAPITLVQAYENATDMHLVNGKLMVLADGVLYYDHSAVGAVSEGAHKVCIMGKKAVIFPDKVIFDASEVEILPLEIRTTQEMEITENSIILTEEVDFVAGDGVTISGVDNAENEKTAVIQSIEDNVLTFYDYTFTAESGTFTLSRTVPDLTYICERDNRVWGVYDDKICCSKLGDPTNWNVFEGLSTDAYEVAVATAGDFTGIAVYGSRLLLFKEDCVHKLYGDKPTNFTISVGHFSGVQEGCARSLVYDQEVLYWWSKDGLLYYDGGVPEQVTAVLGEDKFTCQAAGVCDRTLWLSLCSASAYNVNDFEQEIYTLDLESGVLLRQNNSKISQFACDGTLYFLQVDGVYQLGEGVESDASWQLDFAQWERITENKQFPQRVTLLLDLVENATFEAYFKRDDAEFEEICNFTAPKTMRRLRLPLRTGRCHQGTLRLQGTGEMVLRAIILTSEKGSERE